MKIFLLSIISLLLVVNASFAQATFAQTDFIVLKKKNNRTIKTFYPGVFISAYTYNDFFINGFIKDIRNDSIYIRQEERRLVGTEFGTKLDTVAYTIGIDYRQIKQFNYKGYTWNHKKGFSQITLPKLMIVGGTGYVLLELINTLYRKESLTQDNKLVSLSIGAGVALAGFGLEKLSQSGKRKYKVVYIKAGTPGASPTAPATNNQ
ncbi:MAG: hypothetical protein QM731_19955 [Chitinophagaceae bacterium]